MIAKEVLSVCFAHGTENKEVDHTYEVVSLEANKGGHEGTTSAAGGGQETTVYIWCACVYIQTSNRWVNRQDACTYYYSLAVEFIVFSHLISHFI